MLKLKIEEVEQYNETTNEFTTTKAQIICLEHSLVSISKWESRWNKPFLSRDEKTKEESIDYIKCMTITPNVDDSVYETFTEEHMQIINAYIEAEMTATKISISPEKPNREIITSEIIYFWMINYNIPFECEKWHINRLLTLINVCNIKNREQKPMSKADIAKRHADLNAARRKAFNSKG